MLHVSADSYEGWGAFSGAMVTSPPKCPPADRKIPSPSLPRFRVEGLETVRGPWANSVESPGSRFRQEKQGGLSSLAIPARYVFPHRKQLYPARCFQSGFLPATSRPSYWVALHFLAVPWLFDFAPTIVGDLSTDP
jgi:hypothetical protein